ncbi:MAG: XdhC family protein [Gemmatimonadetes bacterium]|nr:XdhC family protein [Gemmatimonadota bacterium]MBI3568518.1 XdhC family protein [Gemmatimonadota bacterium]
MSLPTILTECARLASGAGAGALASVARRRGSLPMSATAKMLVTAGGARIGTVGGGCLESEIIERAMDVLERRVPAVSEHSLNAELAGDYGLTCGGTAVMLIEPVFPDEVLRAVYAAAVADVARGANGVMATGVDWSTGVAKAYGACGGRVQRAGADGARLEIVGAGDALAGDNASAARLAERIRGFDASIETPLFEHGVLVEPIRGKPRLVVFGGGHVGARIAEVAAIAGWRVTVVDDRADFADAARLPFAERTVTCDWHDVASAVPLDEHTYAVIATRGHQHDVVLAAQLAPRPLRYLGMLGSRRKVALTANVLREWQVDDTAILAMHAPVGLPIGADTPEEIAVSVVAEMIAVRRAGSPRRGGVDAEAGRDAAPAAPSAANGGAREG